MTPATTADAYAECLAMRPVVDAVVAEQQAGDVWEASRGEPMSVQAAAFQRLQEAYDRRRAVVRKWIKAHPVETDGEGLWA